MPSDIRNLQNMQKLLNVTKLNKIRKRMEKRKMILFLWSLFDNH